MNRPLRIRTEAAKGMGGQEITSSHAGDARAWRWRCCASPKRAARWHATTVSPCTPCAWGLLRLAARHLVGLRLVRRERYDVVNTTSRRDALIAAAGARLGGTPLVIRSRHLMSPVNSLLTYTGLPHRVMTVSSFVQQLRPSAAFRPSTSVSCRQLQSRRAGARSARPIPGNACRRCVRAPSSVSASRTSWSVAWRCCATRGMPTSCRRVPLCRTHPNLHLVVIGDGQPVMDRLQRCATSMGCSNRSTCSAIVTARAG